jgi:putative flippase GtrA
MSQTLPHQAVRYGLVGILVYLLDLGTYGAIVTAEPSAYLAANAAGKVVGAATGFVLHRRFTFSWEQKARPGAQALSYFGLLLFNLTLSAGLLWLAVAVLGFDRLPIRVAVDAIVIAVAFLGMRHWVYRPA